MMAAEIDRIIAHCIEVYGEPPIPLHRPVFCDREKQYLIECIDSNFVSSVGEGVGRFESQIAEFVGSKYGVATVNGTAALHTALLLVGVLPGDEVVTQALAFVATTNSIAYTGADAVFVDVDRDTLGMSPIALKRFLSRHAAMKDGVAYNKTTGKRLSACLPMHTFGIPCRIREIAAICEEWNIPVVEDAAESLGSYVGDTHTGRFSQLSVFSFNGNKIITTGGGGMIVTDNKEVALKAKHITTTAKIPHAYEFEHDMVGYNYRMPNLNAVLGCAQMEKLPRFLVAKESISNSYAKLFGELGVEFVSPLSGDKSNAWLNAILLESKDERDKFLEYTNSRGIMTRPIWKLMPHLKMYSHCYRDELENSMWLEDRIVNLPSSVPD